MNTKSPTLLSEEKMISYAHSAGPAHTRFVQFEKDPVPKWAVDIRPYTPPVDIKNTTVKQAYEWVKTGHWSFKQFEEWYDKNLHDY